MKHVNVGGGPRLNVDVGGLQSINRDGVMATVNVEREVLWTAVQDAKWAVVHRLQRSSDSVMPDEDVRG